MKMIISVLLLFGVLSGPTFAIAIERIPVEARIENSSLVVIGTVSKVEQLEDEHYWSKASISVTESSVRGFVGKEITFYHLDSVQEQAPQCCGDGVTYLFFLKKYKDGFASSSGRNGAYEIIREVPLFLDETWMRTSLEHAEILLYLHHLSCSERANTDHSCSPP